VSTTLHCALEAHVTAATLYLRGTLSSAGTLLALRCCDDLPDSIRTLRVDLHGVDCYHPTALDALLLVLRGWRERRASVTRVELPGRGERSLCLLG
jgi:hypothetical protein